MKKLHFCWGFLLLIQFGYAQVGINTTTPNAQLEIKSSNQVTPANTDGILIPKINAFPVVNPTASQQGMMVYLTTTIGLKLPGFYYWDNTTLSWLGVGTKNNWSLTGNSGTAPGLNFIGTTDNKPLVFKVNNQYSGEIEGPADGLNAFFGYQSGMVNNSYTVAPFGKNNSAFGYGSLSSNTNGYRNSAFGYNSLSSNVIGRYNTAFGCETLSSNTDGSGNLAIGDGCLKSNTSGGDNTAIGYFSLRSNTLGHNNVAIGYYPLFNNTTGF